MAVVLGCLVLPAAPTDAAVATVASLRLSTSVTGGTVSVSGWALAPDRAPVAGVPVTVTRSGPTGTAVVGTFVTGDDGAVATTDAPPTAGRFSYRLLAAPSHVAVQTARVLTGPPQVIPAAPAPQGLMVQVDLPSFIAMAVDDLHHRVFISARDDDAVLVFGDDGILLATIAGLGQPSALAMDAFNATLYAFLDNEDAVAVVDTATMSVVGRIPVPAPFPVDRFGEAAVAGGKLAFTYLTPARGWGLIPTSDPGAAMGDGPGPHNQVHVAASPNRPEVALASPDSGASGFVYDVSGDTPQLVSSAWQFPVNNAAANAQDLRYDPSDDSLLLAAGWPYVAQRVDRMSLAAVNSYEIGPYLKGIAPTRDGRYFAVTREGIGRSITVLSADGMVRWDLPEPGSLGFWPGAVDFSDDANRLYVVRAVGAPYTADDAVLEIRHLPLPPCTVTVSGGIDLGESYAGFSGQALDARGRPLVGALVTPTAFITELPTTTTGPDGRFVVPYQLPAPAPHLGVFVNVAPGGGHATCNTSASIGPSDAPPAVHAGAPQSVTAVAGDGYVTASWSPPVANGAPAVLTYSAIAVRNGAVAAWQNVPGDARSVSLPRLQNGSAYDVIVVPWTRLGAGVPSAEVRVTPSSSGPAVARAGIPPAAQITSGKGGISATWTPGADGGAPVVAYSLAVRDTVTGTVRWSHVAADVRNASVGGLVDDRRHEVTLFGWTAMGPGLPAMAIATPSASNAAPVGSSPPRELTVSRGKGTFSLGWQAPAVDGGRPIVAYSAFAIDMVTNKVTWAHTGPDGRSASLSGLVTNRPYNLGVFAWTSAGPGAPTPTVLYVRPS